jgi:hypothetical protein
MYINHQYIYLIKILYDDSLKRVTRVEGMHTTERIDQNLIRSSDYDEV